MQHSLEQRYAIKFCVKLAKSPTKTFDIIKQAYPDVTLARSNAFWWHQALLEGQEEVANEDNAGIPSTNTDNVACVYTVLNSYHRLSIRLIAQMSNLPKSIVCDIVLVHLMCKACTKMVPKMLSDDLKLLQGKVWQENFSICERDPQF
ncbi:hypothetical protein QYM36_004438 [Artemia franciscana]|uniref:Mos1 transposase HTH domain-containing protein n=1 Tax=Artemia franciscana TaxID=6661 RepID=A0AA88I301_ARTSF|nr:hypothetical protein QYM36_004438 [Artemia franciscana]